MSTNITAYSATKIYPVKPKEMKITRQYEEEEYAFVASELDLELIDADELYDDVIQDVTISIGVEKDGVKKFLGTFQQDGASYDPEEEIYKFKALHISKRVFQMVSEFPMITRNNPNYNFDHIEDNWLGMLVLCDVKLLKSNFEFANESVSTFPKSGNNPTVANTSFQDFLDKNNTYSLRDYWIEFAKYFRSVLFFDDALSEGGLPQLNVVPRKCLPQDVITGIDSAIAEYNEKYCNAAYDGVLFPCLVAIVGYAYPTPALCYYRFPFDHWVDRNDAPLSILGNLQHASALIGVVDFNAEGNSVIVPDRCLDLRPKMFGNTWGYYPMWKSLPVFTFATAKGDAFAGITPSEYANRNYKNIISPYKEVEILYSQLLPIAPLQQLAVCGVNMQVWKIEDDIVNETSKVTGRIYL